MNNNSFSNNLIQTTCMLCLVELKKKQTNVSLRMEIIAKKTTYVQTFYSLPCEHVSTFSFSSVGPSGEKWVEKSLFFFPTKDELEPR